MLVTNNANSVTIVTNELLNSLIVTIVTNELLNSLIITPY